jgi:hypothetical protein
VLQKLGGNGGGVPGIKKEEKKKERKRVLGFKEERMERKEKR